MLGELPQQPRWSSQCNCLSPSETIYCNNKKMIKIMSHYESGGLCNYWCPRLEEGFTY